MWGIHKIFMNETSCFLFSTSCTVFLKPDFLIAVSCVLICVTMVTERPQGHSLGHGRCLMVIWHVSQIKLFKSFCFNSPHPLTRYHYAGTWYRSHTYINLKQLSHINISMMSFRYHAPTRSVIRSSLMACFMALTIDSWFL